MPRIIGKSCRVVDNDGMSIDELAGNIATKEDRLSIALVRVETPTEEPWLTLRYNEWICVLKGRILLQYESHSGDVGGDDNSHPSIQVLEVKEGETCFIESGERFKLVFPYGGTEYVPVCLPAFRPERCVRENETSCHAEVSQKLKTLHGEGAISDEGDIPGLSLQSNTATLPNESVRTLGTDHSAVDLLYHMCQKNLWEHAVELGEAYFPPTFHVDGHFTHATAVLSRLIETANHFYKETKGEWICLELSRKALQIVGIVTKFEESKPVGGTPDNENWEWICPHIYGGIPNNVVTNIYHMVRSEDGTFLGITDLV